MAAAPCPPTTMMAAMPCSFESLGKDMQALVLAPLNIVDLFSLSCCSTSLNLLITDYLSKHVPGWKHHSAPIFTLCYNVHRIPKLHADLAVRGNGKCKFRVFQDGSNGFSNSANNSNPVNKGVLVSLMVQSQQLFPATRSALVNSFIRSEMQRLLQPTKFREELLARANKAAQSYDSIYSFEYRCSLCCPQYVPLWKTSKGRKHVLCTGSGNKHVADMWFLYRITSAALTSHCL